MLTSFSANEASFNHQASYRVSINAQPTSLYVNSNTDKGMACATNQGNTNSFYIVLYDSVWNPTSVKAWEMPAGGSYTCGGTYLADETNLYFLYSDASLDYMLGKLVQNGGAYDLYTKQLGTATGSTNNLIHAAFVSETDYFFIGDASAPDGRNTYSGGTNGMLQSAGEGCVANGYAFAMI